MRTIIALVVAGMACLGQPVLAAEQTTGSGISRQVTETWDKIKAFSLDKKSDAVAFGRKLLKEGDARIAELETKASTASGEAKVEYDRQLANLRAARADAAAKLAKMEKAGGHAWTDAKQGFADAYKDMQGAYGKTVGSSK